MELVGHLSGETQPKNPAWHARDVAKPVAEVRGWVSDAGALEEQRGTRSGDVDRAERPRLVEDADVGVGRVGPVPNPRFGLRRAAAREREDEPRLTLPADHAVVNHMTAFVEEKGVARSAGCERGHAHRIQVFEQPCGVGTGHAQLAERADVPEGNGLADRGVLRGALSVGPRTPP